MTGPTFTNIHGLPQSIVEAVKNDPYRGGGDISVTKLIDAPQIVRLQRKHKDDITIDVSERIWSLLGQGVHSVLERAANDENEMVIAEKRLFFAVSGWILSGQFDVMDLTTGKITDYKVTTVYKRHGNDRWTQQLNILRWLAVKNGYDIRELEIVAVFRDWRKTDAQRKSDYPVAAIQTIVVPVWTMEETEQYIEERVALHQHAALGGRVDCTDEDRWYDGTTFAIKKPGAARALKVTDNIPDEGDVPAGYVVEKREGEYKRCAHYCEVAPFCPQWGGGSHASEEA